MTGYIVKRLLMVIPTILFVTSTIFILIQLIPGDVITNMLVDFQYRYSERDMESVRESLGIDVPIYVQYFRWMWDLLQGDLGRSLYTNRSVTQDVLAKLPSNMI